MRSVYANRFDEGILRYLRFHCCVVCRTLRRPEGRTKNETVARRAGHTAGVGVSIERARLIEQIRANKRALVLTQRGRSAAVVLDGAEYDRLIEELELLRDVQQANTQIAAGKGVSEKRAGKTLLGFRRAGCTVQPDGRAFGRNGSRYPSSG